MAKTYQANHFTGQQLDEHMSKVLNKSFAGQGLTIDGEGILHNTAPGYGTLLKSYTHTSNKEVHPEAVDVDTGYFTATAHGLVQNQMVFVAVNAPYHLSKPYQLLPKGLQIGVIPSRIISRYYVQVIDENTFGISTARDGTVLTYTASSTMDLTKFHFEEYKTSTITLDGLPNLTEALAVIEGRTAGACRYVEPSGFISNGGYYGFANYDDFTNTATNMGDTWIGYNCGWGSVYSTIEFKYIGERHLLQTKTEDTLCFGEDNVGQAFHNRTYLHRPMNTDSFTQIKFYMYFAMFNGTTIRIYGKA